MSRLLAVLVAVPFVVGAAVGAAPSQEEPEVLLRFGDPAIVESSGLVARDGLVATVNDSGDTGRTFVVDRDGETVGGAFWDGATDVEALAPLEEDLLVGDLGDNRASRDTVSILRVPGGPGESQVDAASGVRLVYPDGPRDAESLLVDPTSGRVLIVSKVLLGGVLYEVPPAAVPPSVGAPAPQDPVRLEEIGSVRGFATDAAFFPDGRHLIVRDYTDATVYTWPDLEVAGTVELPEQEQGEGIAVEEVDGAYRVLVSSEGMDSEVLLAPLPRALADAVAPVTGSSAGEGDPDGAASPAAPEVVPFQGDPAPSSPPLGPWLIGGAVMLVAVVLLVRSLRPR